MSLKQNKRLLVAQHGRAPRVLGESMINDVIDRRNREFHTGVLVRLNTRRGIVG